MSYLVKCFLVSLFSILLYFGLYLCGVPAAPIGYLGAVFVGLSVLHIFWFMYKSAVEGEL